MAVATLELGTEQVLLLLRTLRLHRDLLEAAHQDAERQTVTGCPPCYLVDYQELHQYMFEADTQLQSLIELEYLFSHEDITFIVGYGTALEVIHRIELLSGVDVSAMPALPSTISSDPSNYTARVTRLKLDPESSLHRTISTAPHTIEAFERLRKLLEKPNFREITQIEKEIGKDIIDQKAFDAARAVLSAVPGRAPYPNLADALNFATVVGLRQINDYSRFRYFPYLLTGTRPLLDESLWANDPFLEMRGCDTSISRKPVTAVYSHIVSTLEPEPAIAASRAAELELHAATLELHLRLTRGYRSDVENREDYTWEDAIAVGQFPPELQAQIKSLREFVTDPLISEAQRIYDNTQRAIAYFRGTAIRSPRKLFDIISGLAHVLNDAVPRALDFTFSTAITTRPYSAEDGSFTNTSYLDVSDPNLPFIRIENHQDGWYSLTWPTGLSADQIVTVFVAACMRHNDQTPVLCVGTKRDIAVFDVELPISLTDITEAVTEPILWLRMNGRDFDLYADVLSTPDITPEVGVAVSKPDREHMAELYRLTSARFIFRLWLDKIFETAGIE